MMSSTLQTEVESEQTARIEANWKLRRVQAKLSAEFDFLRREIVQLCQKSFKKPSTESIDLTEGELRFLKETKEQKLREIVTKQCLSTIKFLMSQKQYSTPFNEPVNTEMYRDYLNYVQKPMDFGTIKERIPHYKNPFEFEQDVRLVFENAKKYNAPESQVRDWARVLETKFEEKWSKSVQPRIIELKTLEMEDHLGFKESKATSVITEAENRVEECCDLLLRRLQSLNEEILYAQCEASSQCGYVSKDAQVRLGWELMTLPPEHFQRAVNLILSRHPSLVATMKDKSIELDLEKMDSLTFWILKDFVKQCMKEGVYEDKSACSSEVTQERKRQKRSTSPQNSCVTSDYLSTSRQEVPWPRVAFGVGLRNYEPETQPFIPITIDDQSLPFSVMFNNRRDASQEESKATIQKLQGARVQETFGEKKRPVQKFASIQNSAFSFRQKPNTAPGTSMVPSTLQRPPRPPTETSVSELRPPTVVVSSTGIAPIPLVPDSRPVSHLQSFFTANLQTPTGQTFALPTQQSPFSTVSGSAILLPANPPAAVTSPGEKTEGKDAAV